MISKRKLDKMIEETTESIKKQKMETDECSSALTKTEEHPTTPCTPSLSNLKYKEWRKRSYDSFQSPLKTNGTSTTILSSLQQSSLLENQ